MMVAGFRQNEIDKKLPPAQPKVRYVYKQTKPTPERRPVMISIGSIMPYVAAPHDDLYDPLTYLAGSRYRIAQQKPRPDKSMLRRLTRFAGKWAMQFEPVPSDREVSVATWLAKTKYPQWRKDEIIKAWDDGCVMGTPENVVGSFVKDEQRSKWGHARTINARPDYFKALFGPMIHEIEEQVFKSAKFAKYVPAEERWKYIFHRLWAPGAEYSTTDFDQYEAHFINEVKEAICMPIYTALTRDRLDRAEFLENYRRFIMSKQGQHLSNKFFETLFIELECSGEMDTSCNNGGTNSCLFDYFNFEAGFIPDEKNEDEDSPNKQSAEGDDGVARNQPGNVVDSSVYRAAGFSVKMLRTFDIEETDFCGVVGESDTFKCTTDPRDVLGTFGYCLSKYVHCKRIRHLELLRAKSMSYLHQYRGSPIIQSLALYGLRVTKHVDMRRFFAKDRYTNRWDMERYLEAYEYLLKGNAVPPVAEGLRMVVESRFGVSHGDQISIEKYLDSLQEITFFNCNVMFDIMPDMYIDYGLRYSFWEGEISEPYVPCQYDNFAGTDHQVVNPEALGL